MGNFRNAKHRHRHHHDDLVGAGVGVSQGRGDQIMAASCPSTSQP